MESQINPVVPDGKVSDPDTDSLNITGAPVTADVDGSVVRRKRGRPPKEVSKPKKEKKEDEDVCFICFDGGSLVLCDRRGCPKAYHPACVKRDEAFFQSNAKWYCGWHICSICQKTAHHMCFTCTYSLCKGCIKKADYVCVRGDKGFCTICMKTIMLIENNGQGEDGKVQADFDDKLSWEYLFKVYWVYLKGKLSLTLNELTAAKNPWKIDNTISLDLPPVNVHNRGDNPMSISATSVGDLEPYESKRRKIDDQINIVHKEAINMEKLASDASATTVGNDVPATTVGCHEWATKKLLDFVVHMKNGSTSVLSRFDVQALMLEYINRNNLRDPKKKNQIICDLRLKSLFGKPRVSQIQMLKLLENHFLTVKEETRKRITRAAVQEDADWTSDSKLTLGKDKKCRNHSKGEARALQNKLDEYAAVNVHNVNLIYLRRDLMENLLEDSENFHGKVVGSIVRIKISGYDLKHDMYRLVQVVGTSKVDVPYKIDSKSTGFMLEILNLDKKETISIDAVSDQEFSQEECRRLQRSIRCGLVKHFTVGEIQEKAMTLQSIKLNDWMEKEIVRLNHLRDIASGKGHKKGYRECVEKLQLLKTPDERERRLHAIPAVHSDPKMNPDYESDDTEEYFNKEDDMDSKYSEVNSKNSRPLKKRAARSNDADSKSRKDEKPVNIEDASTKDASVLALAKSLHEVDCNGSTITKLDHQTTLSSSVSNSAPEKIASSVPNDAIWHYLDPNGKVQGPFSMVQLQMWNTTGYFPTDMRIWANHKNKSQLLNDVLNHQLCRYDDILNTANKVVNQTEDLTVCTTPSSTVAETPYASNHDDKSQLLNDLSKDQLPHYDENLSTASKVDNQTGDLNVCSAAPSSTVAETPYASNHEDKSQLMNDVLKDQLPYYDKNLNTGNKVVNHTEDLNVCSATPSSTVAATPYASNPEKLPLSNGSLGQSFCPNWSANNNLNSSPPTVQLNTSNEANIKHAPTAAFDLPGPAPKKIAHEDDKIPPVMDSGNPPSWSKASSLVGGEAKLPVSGDQWGGSSSTVPVKPEEWVDSGIVPVSSFRPPEAVGDRGATPTSNIDQNIHSSQPICNDFTTWHGMGEMIEFSTLAEESVSDLLAEVDAMESQYGAVPSPTSKRNSFVDDLFNGSFDEFSPTPDQGTRSDGSSSIGDIQLPCQSNTATDEHLVGFDFMKTSNGSQHHSFISQMTAIPQRTNTENMDFKWPEMEKVPQVMIDINRSAKAEGDEGEMEIKTIDAQAKVTLEKGNHIQPMNSSLDTSQNHGGGIVQKLEPTRDNKSIASLSGGHAEEGAVSMQAPKSVGSKLVTKLAQIKGLEGTTTNRRAKDEEDGELIHSEVRQQPLLPPPPLTLGLDPFGPSVLDSEAKQGKLSHSRRPGQGTITGRSGNIGQDPNPSPSPSPSPRQRRYGGERHNSSNSPRERSHQVKDSGYSRNTRSSWNKQSSLGSGSGSGGGYSRPPSKGQRVCWFYENGRCKKGSSCKYLHPKP